mmetsp:Transcript_1062/g.2988  ORF Transcript_1062/g.2988 Transcript_1062/m.2988 type:complete len:254 (-) Transcript_1062:266-1027(-)
MQVQAAVQKLEETQRLSLLLRQQRQVQGMDAAALQQLIRGGTNNVNMGTGINDNLLSSLLHVQQPQLQQQQRGEGGPAARLQLLQAQHDQIQQLQAQHLLEAQAQQQLRGHPGQQLPLQLQLQLQLQLARQNRPQAQAQPPLQAQNILASLFGAAGQSTAAQAPAPPPAATPAGALAGSGIDLANLVAALNANNNTNTSNNHLPPPASAANGTTSSTAHAFDWMRQSAPGAFQKLCQDAGLTASVTGPAQTRT